MRHFAILTLPDGLYACTANPDGSIPLSSQCVAAQDKPGDRLGNGLRSLVDQANAAHALFAALEELTRRCDGHEGTRADGSNIQTMRAHAALEAARGIE